MVLVVLVIAGLYLENLIPGLRVSADPGARVQCEEDSGFLYRWDVTSHAFVCGDNWFIIPGFHGV